MKKLSFLMIAALVAMSSVFVSCTDDEAIDHATISFDNVTGDKVTLEAGASTYVLNASIVSPVENLKEIKVSKKTGSETVEVQKPITSGFDSKTEHHLTVSLTGITEDCEIIVTVNNGTEYAKTLTIDWTEGTSAAKEISTFTGVKMICTLADGSLKTAAASIDGTLITPKTATAAEAAKCDLVYFNGKMYSPKNLDAAITAAFSSAAWSTKRETLFAALTNVDFAKIDGTNIEATAGAPTTQNVAVAKDAVVAFKTQDGKLGIFKVTDFKAGSTGNDYCTIDIKVIK